MFSVCLLDLLVGLHIATLKTVRSRQPSSGCNLRGLRPGIINSKISLVEGGSLYHQLRCQLQKLLKIVNQSNLKVNILENSYKILFKVSTHWFNIFCFISIFYLSRRIYFHLFIVFQYAWLNDQIEWRKMINGNNILSIPLRVWKINWLEMKSKTKRRWG